MGKSLIITESEKKRILSLYEAAPPPSESVLVANKNPYKSTEFISARRPYSPSLKDGNLFVRFNPEKIDDLENKLENDVKNVFNGKTIRINDNIYKFPDDIIIYPDWGAYGTNFQYFDEFNENFTNYKLYPLINSFGIKYTDRDDGIISGHIIRLKEDLYLYDLFNKPSQKKFSSSIYYQPLNNPLRNSSFQKVSEIPDEYFEIRKIQRQQTDF